MKKCEELKQKIIEKERLLYDRVKLEQAQLQRRTAVGKAVGNKWERFNQNLDKLRQNDLNITNAFKSQSGTLSQIC